MYVCVCVYVHTCYHIGIYIYTYMYIRLFGLGTGRTCGLFMMPHSMSYRMGSLCIERVLYSTWAFYDAPLCVSSAVSIPYSYCSVL